MITGSNASKEARNTEYVDIPKYVGVASVEVVAINPNNDKLRHFGWTIPEGADEPVYVTTNAEGKKSTRIRFLVKIHDLDDKPIVAMDFWIRPDVQFNADATKAKIIDSFGRTAWGTKEEIKGHLIPQYSTGQANVNSDYKPCHYGEEELVRFLLKYLNVTPYQIFSQGRWTNSKNPGHLTIDRWAALCNGDVTEIAQMLSMQPENKVKVVFGVRTTDDNKSFQTFLPTVFIGNGAVPDRLTGEYASARKAIDKYLASSNERRGMGYSVPSMEFSARIVSQMGISSTEVKDNSSSDLPGFEDPSYTEIHSDDLPFD